MILFPAIDLIDGKVVRLERGDRSRMTVYSNDPAAMARSFVEQGAAWVHVVDLSAAFEEDEAARAANAAAIRAICQVEGLSVDVGGGVRSLDRIEELADLGCKRIAIGTPIVRDPEFARQAAAEFGDLLVADVAARDGEVKVNGWREGAALRLEDVVPPGVFVILCIPISRATACRRASIRRHIAAWRSWRAFRWWRRAASRRSRTSVRWPLSGRRSSRAPSRVARCMRERSRWEMLLQHRERRHDACSPNV